VYAADPQLLGDPIAGGVVGLSTVADGVVGASSAGAGVRGVAQGDQSGVIGEVVNAPGVNRGAGVKGFGAIGVVGFGTIIGVKGLDNSGSNAIGVWGESQKSLGVFGLSHDTALSPGNAPGGFGDVNIQAGVWGNNQGAGYGLRGTSTGEQGSVGIFGQGKGIGVVGFGATQGIFAQATGSAGVGLEGTGIQAGIKGQAAGAGIGKVGVWGRSNVTANPSDPVVTAALQSEAGALNSGGRGVIGVGQNVGVQGIATTGHGVDGLSVAGIGIAGGTSGITPDSVGVFGIAKAGGAAFAGKFVGNVDVKGNLTKSGGGFRIDHPLAPTTKYLNHSFVESAERKNVYDGVAVLDGFGEAVVDLPPWFQMLNSSFRYQLTCIRGFAPIYIGRELADNRFVIAGGYAGLAVSWQVTGVRSDAWAAANPVDVEEDKRGTELDRYRHSELADFYNQRERSGGCEPEGEDDEGDFGAIQKRTRVVENC
jgi:hypothetical protein